MARNITITFSDGASHRYENIPDTVTPDMIESRVNKDFPGKKITNIDGGKKEKPNNKAAAPVKPSTAPIEKGFLSNLFSKSTPASKPEDGVEIKLNSWDTGGFGGILLADFTITNNNPYPIKDIEILCVGRAESGTVIDHNKRDVYTTIQPGQTKTYKQFNMGFLHSQVERIGCRIKKVEKAD